MCVPGNDNRRTLHGKEFPPESHRRFGMSVFRPAGTALNLPVGIVCRTPVWIAATEKDVSSGNIHRDMQDKEQRRSGSGFLPEESKLFRQNFIRRIVDHQNLKPIPVDAVRQRIASLIQGKKPPAGPFLPQRRFRSRQPLIMPVVISRGIEPGDSGVIQRPESKFYSGFGRKTQKVAGNQDRISPFRQFRGSGENGLRHPEKIAPFCSCSPGMEFPAHHQAQYGCRQAP